MKLALLSTLLLLSSGTENLPTPSSQVNQKIPEKVLYFSAGALLKSASILAKLGWATSLFSPWSSTVGNEWFLLSHLCERAAHRAFLKTYQESTQPTIPLSQSSWHLNKSFLSQVPAASDKEKELLFFLERRWLAKSAGFFPVIIDWICPCFGVFVQVHPESENCYARDPWTTISKTYSKRVLAWKRHLPHPQEYPLILTRPFDLQEHLPSCQSLSEHKTIEIVTKKIALEGDLIHSKVILDFTDVLPQDLEDREKWLLTWQEYQDQLFHSCKEHKVSTSKILCIQRLKQKGIGGIRLLPLADQSREEIELDHRFLLEWISLSGLTASRVELDRLILPSDLLTLKQKSSSIKVPLQSKEAMTSYLSAFDHNVRSNHPQKKLMLKGTLNVLKGLLASLSKERWTEIVSCPTRLAITQFSFLKIKDQLNYLAREEENLSFFDTISHIEQIHANLSSLLEVFSPFTSSDFPPIYHALLKSVPKELKPLTSCALHASGMTSMAGISKAVEEMTGAPPRVLYGENIYFECFKVAKWVTNSAPIDEATREDWQQVDLILAQFNPALKRIDLLPTEYKEEEVAQILRRALLDREKPLTLALDCTFDFIDSPRVGRLLDEFQGEIQAGYLNVICYRSGLKFDLFGMDNYCGAPFYMIHNQDAQWACFDSLLNDQALEADHLSSNWFCLAYKSAPLELDLYRKQVFDNTRALLSRVPSRLFDPNSNYRIVPTEERTDPTFVDIKVFGPLHCVRGAALAGGLLYLKCMEHGAPIFYRRSVGFYHSNFSMLFCKENATIRLTLGLDPAEVDLFVEVFEMLDALNGSPPQFLPSKVKRNFFR